MLCKRMLWLIASVPAFGQNGPRIAPIPNDALEMVTGEIQVAGTPQSREAALQLLDRARNNYDLRSAGQGYDLKVTFSVTSGGQTQYDGAWKMEDVFNPQRGLRWTANAADAYAATRISSNETVYGEGTASYFHFACMRRGQRYSRRFRLRGTSIGILYERQPAPSMAYK